jgi:Ca2+-binding RTX toxin-like protein
VSIQVDGKIVVAGGLGIPGGSFSRISRYNPNGSLDESFEAAEGSLAPGIVAIDLAPNSNDEYYGLAIQDNGQIIAVGRAGGGTDQNFSIVRFEGTFVSTTAPTLDPLSATLDENGFTFTAIGHDADVGDILTYSLTEAPKGATIDPQTGVFNWTPGEDQLGSYTVTVRVTDRGGLYAEESIILTTLGMVGESLIYVGSASKDSMAFVEGSAGEITAFHDGVVVATFSSVKRIVANGLAGNDVLVSNAAIPCVFNGGTGSDMLKSGRGFDQLSGGRGADTILGGGGNDYLIGGKGIDLIFGGGGNDRLAGGVGVDRLIDDSGANQFDWSHGEYLINAFAPIDARWKYLEQVLSWRIWDLAGGVTFTPPLP